LLLKAHKLDPQNPKWPRQLGRTDLLGRIFIAPGTTDPATLASRRTALHYLEVAYGLTDEKARMRANEEGDLFLLEMSTMALTADERDKATTYASELLKSLDEKVQQSNWSYGNAIHDANLVLGHVALADGKIAEAKEFLLAAGKTPGSPQLGSFGPNMSLAEQLLKQGEKQTVLEYFELCRKFWKSGQPRLDTWKKAVETGEIPNFSKY
jgi:hypothetical protein